MNKICLVRQPAGLGDILYIQKILHAYHYNNYNVILPVNKELNYVTEYISVPFSIIDENSDFKLKHLYNSSAVVPIEDDDGNIYLPLQKINFAYPDSPIMTIKYDALDIPHSDWVQWINLNRNTDKELKLFERLNLSPLDEYIFVNRNYGTPPNHSRKDFNINTNKKIVEMKMIDEFNPFDWLGVIEHASEIHTVETVIVILTELINTKSCVNVYQKGEKSFDDIKLILTQNDYKYNIG